MCWSIRFILCLVMLYGSAVEIQAGSSFPPRFTVRELARSSRAYPLDINERGDVVGSLRTGSSCRSCDAPFLYLDGQVVSLPTTVATAFAVNDTGEVVGLDCCTGDGVAFIYDDVGYTYLGSCAMSDGSEAYDINNHGIVVGVCYGSTGTKPAYFDGSWHELPTLSDVGWDGAINAINDSGEMVGYADDETNKERPCRFVNGLPERLPCPDGDCGNYNGQAYGINEAGVVVGYHFGAVVWDTSGAVTRIGPSGSYALAINSCDWIVGRSSLRATLWLADSTGYTEYDLNALVQDATWFGTLDKAVAVNDRGFIAAEATLFGGFEQAIVVLVPDSTMADSTDSDGDGIWDRWECCGIDANQDGRIDYKPKGADPRHKDLYVEIDGIGSAVPDQTAIDMVINAFAIVPNADLPTPNPDGVDGVTLHVDVDDVAIEAATPLTCDRDSWPNQFDTYKQEYFGSSDERLDSEQWENIRAAKRRIYRYCLWVPDFIVTSSTGTTSHPLGRAEIGGNDFLVSLGGDDTGLLELRASAFMHELGHTLGLRHGGRDDIQFKPNYYSIMNYYWALSTTCVDWGLVYSHVENPTLDESLLYESTGLRGMEPDGLGIIYMDGMGSVSYGVYGASDVDWDGDGSIDAALVNSDLNYIFPGYELASPGQVLTGHDDWANLDFDFRDSDDYADLVHLTVTDEEMDTETVALIASLQSSVSTPGPSHVRAAGIALEPPAPSPFTNLTNIRFALHRKAMVTLSVHDVSGRRVLKLAEGELEAGAHSVAWAGDDRAGSKLPAGIYFVRLCADGETAVRRVVLLD